MLPDLNPKDFDAINSSTNLTDNDPYCSSQSQLQSNVDNTLQEREMRFDATPFVPSFESEAEVLSQDRLDKQVLVMKAQH